MAFTRFAPLVNPMKKTALLILLAATALGAEPAAPASPFDPIAFWVGGSWHGQLPPPPGGGTAPTLVTTFAWMENRRAIRFDTVAVAGERRRPYTSGVYGWHPARKTLVFWYTDAAGGLTEGTVVIEGGVLVHEFTAVDAAGQVTPYRARVTPDGADAYWNEIFHQENGEWKSFVKVRYERR